MTIGAYPSIYAIGHRAINNIFESDVFVEEKVDGSQFSFMRDETGALSCRSKNKFIDLDNPDKMFKLAVGTVADLNLHPGWVYRGEYLKTPKHNTLAYTRTPVKNVILFDVQTGLETYLDYGDKAAEAYRIGLEVVPLIRFGKISQLSEFMELLKTPSILGNVTIEGVVVKNYNIFTATKKIAIGKYVSEAFKEKNQENWKAQKQSILPQLIDRYKTEARWRKSIQHLRDDSVLEGSPRDIGKLIPAIQNDILEDSEAEIKDILFKHFWPQISKGAIAGFPEFYKHEIAHKAFEKTPL